MEKIKVALFVKGNILSHKGVVAQNVCANVSIADERFDFSRAVRVCGDLTVDADIIAGNAVIAATGYISAREMCAPEHMQEQTSDMTS